MIKHLESGGSRTGTDAADKSSAAELKWSVWGHADPLACRDYLRENDIIPAWYDGLRYKSITWDNQGGDNWEFRASYEHPDSPSGKAGGARQELDTGDYTFSFDTGGGSVKRMVSDWTTSFVEGAYFTTAPDYKHAIGVTDDGVEGVDVVIPALKFSIHKRVPRLTLTLAYINVLHTITGTTNNAEFFSFASGELLFLGASGQESVDGDPEITYNFLGSPNVTDLTLGEITGIEKQGHQYLWVKFEKEEDTVANITARRPKAVYVEDVYESSDFSKLGI